MKITFAQRGDIIDALSTAIETLKAQISSNLAYDRSVWDETDQHNYDDWNGRVQRYRCLRRRLLKEERAS